MAAFASAPRHRAQRRAPLRSMAVVTSAVAGATLLTLGATGTTLAMWSDSAPVSAGSVATGSLNLQIDTNTDIDLSDTLFRDMLPGDRNIQEVVLTTSGNVSSDVTVAGAIGVHEVRVASGSCPGTAIGGAALGSTPVDLGEWSAEQTKTVCIEVTLPASALPSAQGATTDFVLTFVATQKVN